MAEITVVQTGEPEGSEPTNQPASSEPSTGTETAVAMEVGALRAEVDQLKTENAALKAATETAQQTAEAAGSTASAAFSEAITAQIAATPEPEAETETGVIEVIPPAAPAASGDEDVPRSKAGGVVGLFRTLFLGR